MIKTSSVRRRNSSGLVPHHSHHVTLIVSLLVAVAACSGDGVFEPTRSGTRAVPAGTGHASVVVTPNYSAFDTRVEFNAAGAIDHLNGFDEFVGDLVYMQPTPWTTNGVTYTSALNIVLGPGIGLGVSSNSVSTEFGAPLSGQFAAADAFTLFGADLTLIGDKVPVGLVVFTNLGSYSFDNLDIPLATSAERFFGIALSNAGEYLTGFRFSVGGSGSALLLDDVAVGHVAVHTNANPDASVGGPYAGPEGSAVTLSMSATDGDGDALTYSWDLGDGTTGSGPTPPSSHVYGDNGTYDVMLAVADGQGGVDTARTTATIANVAPSLAAFALPATPLALTSAGVSVPVSTTFTDPGTLDTHTATLDCGSGAASEASALTGTASGLCTFSSAGLFTVKLTVRDDDGDSDTKVASGRVIVYDANGGWITGGGWIVSPAGACAAASTITGKLSFNILARYEAGSTRPTGSAEFKLNVGKIDFASTSLDWMVVGDGVSQVEGRGRMSGAGDYAFAMRVTESASGDAIRIRIWNRTSGAVVYDSKPGQPFDGPLTPLAGGNIQLH